MRHPQTGDRGVAMILVVAWSAILLGLAAVVSTAVLNQVRPSDRVEKSYQAWSAAEAGVEDMRARLAANGDYWKQIAAYYASPGTNASVVAANPALAGWVSVPGGTSDGQFTYWVDLSQASRSGRMVISATGRAGTGVNQVTRTVEVQVQKKTTNEYAYLSNSETYPYDAPGVYGGGKKMDAAVAEVLCGTGGTGGQHYWYQWTDWGGTLGALGPVTTSGPTSTTPTGTGPHKNSVACLHGEVTPSDRWVGPIHTNDVWYIDPSVPNIDPNTDSGQSTQVFVGAVTSSCPASTSTSTANSVCRENHRYIATTTLPGESNLGTNPSSYTTNEIPDIATENNKLWNPTYDDPVEMPSDAQVTAVKNLATQKGCVFSGPTRIRLYSTGTYPNTSGKLVITSPDTVDGSTNSFCFNGQSFYATTPTSQPTITLDYATMVAAGFNGLIFVQDSSLGSNAPTCKVKAVDSKGKASYSNYPWVIPTDASDSLMNASTSIASIPSGATPGLLGLPSQATAWTGNKGPGGVYDEWTNDPAQQCAVGHVYMQATKALGGYTGQYTIAANGDIVITDDIYEASVQVTTPGSGQVADPAWGIPQTGSTNQLGLVARRWIYAYHLQQSKGGNNGNIGANLRDLLLDFSILAPNKCLTVQDYDSQPAMNWIKVVGSLGQDNRCRVTDGSAGYNKGLLVTYDTRLPLLGPPPYMAELSQEPWKIKSWSESNVRRDLLAKAGVTALTGSQAAGSTKSYNVLASAPTGSSLQIARVVSGSGTVSIVNNQVQYVAPNGVTTPVVEWTIRKPDGTLVAQTLTISVT